MKNHTKVDFFYIFIFNCVKLWIKLHFIYQSEWLFEIKTLPL